MKNATTAKAAAKYTATSLNRAIYAAEADAPRHHASSATASVAEIAEVQGLNRALCAKARESDTIKERKQH